MEHNEHKKLTTNTKNMLYHSALCVSFVFFVFQYVSPYSKLL